MLKLLTISEAADILKLSYDKTLWLVKYGDLPYIPIGRQYRIDEKDLEDYINRIKKN